jgi:hypothetical protein
MSNKFMSIFDGDAGPTITFTASADTAYSLSAMSAGIINAAGAIATGVLISVESQSCRISFVTPASQSLGHLRTAGEAFQISSGYSVSKLSIANAVAGSNFKVQITPFFTSI